MSRVLTRHPTSPGSNGVAVSYYKVFDGTTGLEVAPGAATPTAVTMAPAYGAAGAARLSPAGIVAALAAAATEVLALSAANRVLIAGQVPGGLAITVTDELVSVPCLYSGVATLAAALATVTATEANTQDI